MKRPLKYHTIEPEVIVGLGDKTDMDNTSTPPTIKYLHIDLEDWLGDDLLECYPCYFVTERLSQSLKETNFTGYTFEDFELTEAEYFIDNYQLKKPFPKLYWLKITGIRNINDFYIDEHNKLLVSKEVLDFMQKKFDLKYCDVDKVSDFEDLFEGI